MKIELDNKTAFFIAEVLSGSDYAKCEREQAYRKYVEAVFNSIRAEEKEKEIATHASNPYLDYLNKVGGDGFDFHGIMNGKVVETVTKEQLKEPNCTVPKLPHIAYKMVDGEKIYIHVPKFER